MATETKSKQAKGKKDGEAYAKSSRCWPGYVPVPGKGEHEEGSCRKAPASKNGGKPVDRETARKNRSRWAAIVGSRRRGSRRMLRSGGA